jgi:hypothetical protein
VRGDVLPWRLSFIEPPLSDKRNHSYKCLRVERRQLGIEASLYELVAQNVFNLFGDVADDARQRSG